MMKYVIAALVLALAGLGFLYRNEVQRGAVAREELSTAKEGLQRAAAQRKADARTLAAHALQNVATGRKLAEVQGALSEALHADSVWGDTQVPDGVQRALVRDSERPNNAPD